MLRIATKQLGMVSTELPDIMNKEIEDGRGDVVDSGRGDVEPILHGPSACVPRYDFRPAEVLFLFGLNGF